MPRKASRYLRDSFVQPCIHIFPVEIIQVIAEFFVNDDTSGSSSLPHPPIEPIPEEVVKSGKAPERVRRLAFMTRLDKRIRYILHETPRLWCQVYLVGGGLSSAMHATRCALYWSKGLPLTVEVVFVEGKAPFDIRDNVAAFLGWFSSRIKSLKIYADKHEDLASVDGSLRKIHLPNLTEMSINCDKRVEDYFVVGPMAPNLRTMSLKGSNLQRDFTRITRLHFTFFVVWFEKLYPLVNQIIALEELYLDIDTRLRFSYPSNWEPEEELNCPHLTSLTLWGGNPRFYQDILSRLRAPSLRCLALGTPIGSIKSDLLPPTHRPQPVLTSVTHVTIYPTVSEQAMFGCYPADGFSAAFRLFLKAWLPQLTDLDLFPGTTNILGEHDDSGFWETIQRLRIHLHPSGDPQRNLRLRDRTLKDVELFRGHDEQRMSTLDVKLVDYK